ncbi:hypothetical protein BLNAU_17442 [Blattamonas nauphoetae]|uniref:Uncharacterized protein n=1 Tax=Blattamonas nauphoetae TaxID=2049346 RepID=A0ABQ9X7D0_9EUKA|nr:hypothetical protein BLNAU_17442 [Blattamonas nauphoetae]
MKQFRFHDVAARRAQAIAEEEEESIVPPPSTPKSQQSRMLFALSTPTRQTPQRVKTEDKVEKMLRNQMSGAVNPGEITKIESWRAGRPVTFSEDEIARYLAFVEGIPEKETKRKNTRLSGTVRQSITFKTFQSEPRANTPSHFLADCFFGRSGKPQAHTLPYSLETQENHRWVYRLLKDFADAMELESVLPLECNVVKQFIYVLGINDLVSVASLDSTVRCALGVLDSLHRGGPTPQAIHSAISDSVNLVKKTKLTPDVSIGKPPLIASDLHTIIVHP